jgi:hypothetical protein
MSGRYRLGLSFVPPAVNTVPLIARGTSANKLTGGTKISERAANRRLILPVRVTGTTDAEVFKGGRELAAFLALASTDPGTPLYLQLKPNSDVAFEPLWGQYGGNHRFEIVHASPPQPWRRVMDADLRENAAVFRSTLEIKPYADGPRQKLASAKGAVLEDYAWWKDGRSRGLIISEGAGNDDNFHTNPVFGNLLVGWTNGANLTDTVNYDERFILFGAESVKLVAIGGTAAQRAEVESLTLAAVDNILSYHVKLPDSSAVSTTQVRIIYNGVLQTETFTLVGDDGWYRVSATVTGTGGAAGAGISVADGYTVYMDAAQAKASSYLTPFVYGDMLGVAWSGGAHGSASDATEGRVRVPIVDTLSVAEGTVRVVWRADVAETSLGGDRSLFDCTSPNFTGMWNNANTDWRFLDATNTAQGAADTFSAGDILIFHFVWNPASGLVLYKAGASYATSATYTPPTFGADMYIGTDQTPGQHMNGTFMGFATFDRAMTAAEVLADYTNAVQLTNDNDRVEPIPYLWTNDGDDQIENEDNGTRYNWCICGGIPGTADADIVLQLNTGGVNLDNWQSFWISRLDLPYKDFWKPSLIINDQSVGDTDAISDSKVALDYSTNLGDDILPLRDKEFSMFLVGSDGSSDTLRLYGSQAPYPTSYTPTYNLFTTQTTNRVFWSPFMKVRPVAKVVKGGTPQSVSLTIQAAGERPDAGAVTFTTVFQCAMFRPLVRVDGTNATAQHGFEYWRGTRITTYDPGGLGVALPWTGEIIRLVPGEMNILQFLYGDDGSDDWAATDSATIDRLDIIPRYAVL